MSISLSHYTTNDSPNALELSLMGWVVIWFSYETVVAFESPWTGRVVSENVWSRTTGKHLNAICSNHAHRVDHTTFQALYDEFERRLQLAFKHMKSLTLLEAVEHAAKQEE